MHRRRWALGTLAALIVAGLCAMMHELGRSFTPINPAFPAATPEAAVVLTDAIRSLAADSARPDAVRADALHALCSRTSLDGVVPLLMETVAGDAPRAVHDAAIQSLEWPARTRGDVQELLLRIVDSPAHASRAMAMTSLRYAATPQVAETFARHLLAPANPPYLRDDCARLLSGRREHLSRATLAALRSFAELPENARIKEYLGHSFRD